MKTYIIAILIIFAVILLIVWLCQPIEVIYDPDAPPFPDPKEDSRY